MRIILLSLCLFVSTILSAQNDVLTEIEKANAAYKVITGNFIRTQTNVAKGTSVKANGTLYIAGEDQMSQYYKAPSTDMLIINGNDFYMIRGKKINKFNTEKNKTMRSLRNTLLYCVHGKSATLAAENGAEITTKKKADGYEVVLVHTKKNPRGYARIVLNYDLNSKLLIRMQMDEFNGNSTLYEMENLVVNGTIKDNVFDIPEK